MATVRTELVSALQLARWILKKANVNGDSVTNLKLQKILYFTQAWHLVNFNRPIFNEPIEAWAYGPVIRSVYENYKRFKNSPIDIRVLPSQVPTFPKRQSELLEEVYEIYMKFPAYALVNMTHNDDPWKNNFIKGGSNCIPITEIRKYYNDLYERSQSGKK